MEGYLFHSKKCLCLLEGVYYSTVEVIKIVPYYVQRKGNAIATSHVLVCCDFLSMQAVLNVTPAWNSPTLHSTDT